MAEMDMDIEAAAKSIGDDLFGSSGEAASVSDSPSDQPVAETAAPTQTTSAEAANAAGLTVAEYDALPKSWKKELEPIWKQTPAEARKYVYEREKQQLEGIMRYKGISDKWDETVKPFGKFVADNKLDIHDAVQRLGTVEMILQHGTPQQKADYLGPMLQHYGLDTILQSMGYSRGQVAAIAGQPQLPPGPVRDPRLDQVLPEVQQMRNYIAQQQFQQTNSEVETFVNDPKNLHAQELVPDMTRLIESKAVKTLQAAYEMALWTNPEVRGKMMAAEVAKATTSPKAAPRSLKSSSSEPAPTGKAKGSMEDTIRDKLAEIRQRA